MDMMARFALFEPLDMIAAGVLFGAWFLLGLLIEHPPKRYPSVTVLTFQYRREWMEQMITRDPRVFDAITMNGLRQGTAFFGSGCMIALGGILALLSNTQALTDVAVDLTASAELRILLQMKLLVVAGLLTHAFLKFVWANRLFGYCAVTMAATPNDITDPLAPIRARQAADISNRAAVNFNRGLRSIYFSLAALGWLLSPYALIATTLLASFTLLSREFASTSRETLRDD
jgi:uncharacterized membrane protein